MRTPFKKVISEIEREKAHGGSGARQLILSKDDAVSSQFEAMTKGFLAPGAVFDWHEHDGVDEFLIVTQGAGVIRFQAGIEMAYEPGQVIYIPANQKHRLENLGPEEAQFFFVRLKA